MTRRPVDVLLDAMVFVPIGALVQARRLVPELAEAGRDHVANRIDLVRSAVRFATRTTDRSRPPTAGRPGTPSISAAGRDGSADPAGGLGEGEEVVVVVEEAPAPSRRRLPIEGYDSLAASQIVARLADLDEAALREVAAYEAGHRNRRTVLAKVAQLRQA
jgi:hypothetical protein